MATLNFLNNHYAPVCSTREDHTFTNPEDITIRRLDSCSYAEDAFADIFSDMDTPPSEREDAQIDWTIVTDTTDQPIAIKRYDGARSALSLVPLAVDGYSYPAGSLFRMSLAIEPIPRYSAYAKKSVTPYTNITLIKFLRLSAFAHEPLEREKLFTDMDSSDPYTRMHLHDITALTEESMQVSARVGFPQPPPIRYRTRDWSGYEGGALYK